MIPKSREPYICRIPHGKTLNSKKRTMMLGADEDVDDVDDRFVSPAVLYMKISRVGTRGSLKSSGDWAFLARGRDRSV